ncbi:DNA ligase D [Jiella marina]|uniref:DNA ligase D n=1 Tax=Jiella sp. LLJ827 TaxID=2917712 RepID=UPI002101D431|nr:DNA ligase D [Jiella sp. LLJ827]MCQ0986451.1 DNA ligase D [Jiella sp. LLJ827]
MASRADQLLKTYRQKRDFAKTAEPSGDSEGNRQGDGLYFCVQKHDATRLHYDFRVEWDGVLKSWAVTKGPSLDPSDKRLAVLTEDHPLSYGDFEGTIPEGQYGGGTVMLWDAGSWEPREDPDEGFRRGSLKMRLFGQKLQGDWALVRMKGKEKRENWLLIKENDEAADRRRNILKADKSVGSGRTMRQIAKSGKSLDDVDLEKKSDPTPPAPKRPKNKDGKPSGARPAFRELQLATLVDEAPEGREWLNEMKFDGYRVLMAVGGGKATCWTRNKKDWTEKFGQIADAASKLDCESALLDGEVVAFDDNGRTDFSTLQNHLSDGGPLACFVFDILELDGEELRKRPLKERKDVLRELMDRSGDGDVLLFSEDVTGSGPKVFANVCENGHEGIIAKRADAPYRGGRSKDWLKVKCTRRQEFVIGGWSPSDKKARAFSSILVGVPSKDGKLAYRGRVGTGFDEETLTALAERFKDRARKTSPFDDLPGSIARSARYVTPDLVAEIDFAEFTADGQIRHGVFKGLREDKAASAVVDEKPSEATDAENSGGDQAKTRGHRGSEARHASKGERRMASNDTVTIAGIRLSHPERVVFNDQGVTKRALAEYYEAVGERMLMHVAGRPLSLVRCPQGPAKHCFFQKHAKEGFPKEVGSVTLTEKDGSKADYLTVDSVPGLVGAVQMNALEFHIWGARSDRLERPDRLVFDLDPDEGLGFEDVRDAAFDVRAALDELGLASVALVTGGKGVHVIAPLERRQGWDELKGFAKGLAARFAEEEPQRFTATMSKAKRKGRIFIDWLRNERGSTAIAPYSTRSRKGAPVACPVSWDELRGLDAANGFSIDAVIERLADPDPWEEASELRQSITKPMLSRVGA